MGVDSDYLTQPRSLRGAQKEPTLPFVYSVEGALATPNASHGTPNTEDPTLVLRQATRGFDLQALFATGRGAALTAITGIGYRVRRWTATVIRLPVVLAFGLFAGEAQSQPYYNSSERGCGGSNTNVVFCDDFEDGIWYRTDCDTSGGITNPDNDGWCGNVFNTITPADAIICGAGVTPFGNCAANVGAKSGGETDQNMALRHLKTASCGTDGTELCGVSTLYVRWYAKWVTGYSFGAEKHLNFTNSDGDIAFANLQLNCGLGEGNQGPTAGVSVQVIHGEDMCDPVDGVTLESNKWYFFEMRVTAHATQGIIQVWINDCGTDGTACGASPTLVYDRSGLRLPGNANGSHIETIWLESWANPVSAGTGPYWDQLKASITGPIGFARCGGPRSPGPAPARCWPSS